jgi:hypothetical protein
MKRQIVLLVAIFLASFFTFALLHTPTRVQAAGCTSMNVGPGSSFTVTYASGDSVSISGPASLTVVLTGPYNATYPLNSFPSPLSLNAGAVETFTFSGSGSATVTAVGLSLPCSSSSSTTNLVTFTEFTDGRLNSHDAWETSAIYCLGDGSVRVYVIGQPQWFIAFDASPAEIAKVSKHPAHNTIIKGAYGAWLSRFPNGSLVVSTPGLNPVDGNYNFSFQDCPVAQ